MFAKELVRLPRRIGTSGIRQLVGELVVQPAAQHPERIGPFGRRLWDIDTGHDLMITEPKAVAELLLRLASG